MEEKDKYPSELAERFQVRLPPGLRDRIKAYAERHGRSMNTEIVRVLEREFPQQWQADTRMEQLATMLSILRSGTADPSIDTLVNEFQETVEGIVSGRVMGVTNTARDEISSLWAHYKTQISEQEYENEQDRQAELDPEELASLERNGTTEKFAVPPPADARPMSDQITLMAIVPKRSLQQLTEKLAAGDLEGAAAVIREIPKDELERRIEFEKLPEEEKWPLTGEEPPFSGTDPFES